MRKLLVLALVSALFGLAVPLHASPPETVEEPFFVLFPDLDYEVAVFWNVTRDGFCAWEAGGFAGPPPALKPVEVTTNETGQAAIVLSISDSSGMELWRLDADADLSGPCQDTDDQPGPLATGSGRFGVNDNDLDVSLTRTNSFGDHGQGRLTGSDGGRWHYSWLFRALIDQDGGFTLVVQDSNLVRAGH
jgi:hypothetical protein